MYRIYFEKCTSRLLIVALSGVVCQPEQIVCVYQYLSINDIFMMAVTGDKWANTNITSTLQKA